MIRAMRSEAICNASDNRVSEPVMTPTTSSAVIIVEVNTDIDTKRQESVIRPDCVCSNSLMADVNNL